MTEYTDEHKVPAYTIREIANIDPDFYSILGPFLSRREVVDELGGPMWDDDGKTWWIAVASEEEVLGTIALHRGQVCSFFITPASRGRSIGAALLGYVLRHHPDQVRKATATEASHHLFQLFGFTDASRRGSFYLMERANVAV